MTKDSQSRMFVSQVVGQVGEGDAVSKVVKCHF